MAEKLKVILLGESGVGKSSIVLRLKSGAFKEKLTITFVDCHEKILEIRGVQAHLTIFDTGGQERFHSIVSSYYRSADGVLLVYDVTNVTTFHKVSSWLHELRMQNEDAEVIIAGNKNEDPTRKAVGASMVKNFAKTENLEYMEISAKSGENVELAFEKLTEKILVTKGILHPTSNPEQDPGQEQDPRQKQDPIQRFNSHDQMLKRDPKLQEPRKSETIKLDQDIYEKVPQKKKGCCS